MPPRNRKRREPSVGELFRLAERADLLNDPVVHRLLTVLPATNSTALKRRIETVVAVKAAQKQRQPFDGESDYIPTVADRLSLGTTITGSTYALEQDDLTQHLLTIGQSGAGKTTFFYDLMDQLTVPFWVFDLKQDYRHLLQHNDESLVLPWTELQFNPLKPPDGVPPRRWAQVFSEIFGHATALLSGSKNYLMTQLIDLYRLYGLFDEVSGPYPSLHELQTVLEQDKLNYVRKTADYRDTVINRLEAMTLTAGPVFDCSQGYPLDELLNRNVIFEFDGLGRDVQNFLMEILFAAVYEYRLAQNQRGGDLRHVFFLDEGKQVFSIYKERQDAAGLPAIDELTAKMREFGEGLVVADQEASKLTDSIKANTYTKVLLPIGDAKQFRDIAASMDLSERQQTVAHRLDVGEAVIRSGNHAPCLVKLNYFDVEKTISDIDLRRRQRPQWNQLTATPRKHPSPFQQQVGDADAVTASTDIPTDFPQQIELSANAKRLLTDIVEQPFRPLTERYNQFASTYQGNQAKNALVDQGLVIERKVHAGSEKRKLLEMTDRGRDYAQTHLNLDTKHRGRGGIVHRYWQYRLKQVMDAAGWTAKQEVFDADVYVNMDDVELAIEVAMGNNKREIEHVEKHLETFDAVWIVCRDEAVHDGLRERLAEQGLLEDRVTLRLVRDIPGLERGSLM